MQTPKHAIPVEPTVLNAMLTIVSLARQISMQVLQILIAIRQFVKLVATIAISSTHVIRVSTIAKSALPWTFATAVQILTSATDLVVAKSSQMRMIAVLALFGVLTINPVLQGLESRSHLEQTAS